MLRPLTIAPPRDKLVQECIRMILEAIYEYSFSECSHGFSHHPGCHHTALKMFHQKFRVASWFIEGDITLMLPSIDHEILINILCERIKDKRFIGLIRKAINAGYWEFPELITPSLIPVTPQGSIISPILANIFLDKLDNFVANLKSEFDVGTKASVNPEWKKLENAISWTSSQEEKRRIHKIMITNKSKRPVDQPFKKLIYIRYADDFVIGIRGSREDCELILEKVRVFLKSTLKMELSPDKTKITNTRSGVARFLSVDIRRFHHTIKRRVRGRLTRVTDALRLTAPLDRITQNLKSSGFLKNNEPAAFFL